MTITTNDEAGLAPMDCSDFEPPLSLQEIERKWASDKRVMIGAIRLAWERGNQCGIPTSLTEICDAYERAVKGGWYNPNTQITVTDQNEHE